MKRPFLCSDQIDSNHPERVIEPKQGSYIDALTECANRASKIASISEIEKWKYAHKNQVNDDSRACVKHFCDYFWTSNKPINNSQGSNAYRNRPERLRNSRGFPLSGKRKVFALG